MKDACLVVEVLGIAFKNELIVKVCAQVLDNYTLIFSTSENACLEKYEKRFSWLWKNLEEFRKKWADVFPDYWGIDSLIIYEFTGLTRIGLLGILSNETVSNNVALLIKAVQATIGFENQVTAKMEKLYRHYLVSEAKPKDLDLTEEH